MNRPRPLALLALTSLILSACNTVSGPILNGPGVIQGTLVDQNIGAPVAGSSVTVYQNAVKIITVQSGADGSFTVSGLPVGSYDLKARKAGLAGSDLYGLTVGDDPVALRMIQRPAFETNATTDGARLTLTQGDGTTPLAGSTFTDSVNFKITTTTNSNHVGPLRVIYAQLGRTPGSGSVTGSSQDGKYLFSPPQDQLVPTTTGTVTLPSEANPNFIKGFGSAAGETVIMEVVTVDFNYNTSRYLVPIKLINTSAAAGTTVVAPTKAAAVSYTLKQEGDWTRPYSAPGADRGAPEGTAAPSGSGVFVELRWCYTDTGKVPFAFDIERSADATTFTRIGTVAGGADAACSANQLLRPFFYRDNSAALEVGKTFTYRVTARGANTLSSETTQTSPLAPFAPTLLAPADETTGVSLTPTFVMGNPQQAIGADGTAYNIRLRDLYTSAGYNLPGNAAAANTMALFRVEEGTGDAGNGVPAGQSLVFTSGVAGGNFVLTDTAGLIDPGKPNLIPVDQAAHTVSLPMTVFTDTPLLPLRPYKWEMYAGYAYKYLPAEGDRVSAYSVYTWPASTILPVPAARPVNQNYDFITGQK